MPTTNFEEHVALMAEESPHALVLDWYRRLELAIRAYLAARQLRFHDGPAAERVIAADPLVGSAAAASIAELRRLRNRHTHGFEPIAPAQAVTFAREAFSLIGRVMVAQDARAT